MNSIIVRDIIGTSFNNEDAIILRGYLESSLKEGVLLDFAGIEKVPTTFLCCLFTDIFNKLGREYVSNHLFIKNLTNKTNFSRVFIGTSFIDEKEYASIIN